MENTPKTHSLDSALLAETIRLLKDRPRSLTLKMVSEQITVSVSWLSSLLSDDPPQGPSVDQIERLYNLLSDKPLFPRNN